MTALGRKYPLILAMLSVLLLSACAETRLAIFAAKEIRKDIERDDERSAEPAPRYKVGKPYQIAGLWYYPHEDPDYDATGIASWYGEDFHGKRTANGDIYNMNAMTAAHKTLPMPTDVEVTNLSNGRSVILTINDRGPFARGRIIDVSRRAAQLLGFIEQGTAKVRVKVINGGRSSYKVASADADGRYVLPAQPREPIKAEPLPEPQTAAKAPAAPSDVKTETDGTASKAILASASGDEFAIGNDGQRGIAGQPVQVGLKSVKPTAMFVQAGTFAKFTNANKLKARLSSYGDVHISNVLVNDVDMFRVRIGPYENVQTADDMLDLIVDAGLKDARIVVDRVP